MLLDVFLPLSLAFIMFSLGLGLTVDDFLRVGRETKGFVIGAATQLIALPIVAFLLLMIVTLPPELALGVMILAFCPGGVTSNIMTKLAGGALALSITLTAIVSLAAVVTVPLLLGWSADYFMGLDAPEVDVAGLAISMFLLTALPVCIGVAVRRFATGFAERFERGAGILATVLFVVIVVGALATNWALFVDNLATVGPVLIALNAVMLGLGFAAARAGGLDHPHSVAVALEAGVQNATVGITVGGIVAGVATGIPAIALPSGVYGITMYLVTAPFILWARSRR